MSHRRTGRGATSITAPSSTGTAGSRHTWPRGSECAHIGEQGSKMRTIFPRIQRAIIVAIGARGAAPGRLQCTRDDDCRSLAALLTRRTGWTRRLRRSETAKWSGLVPGIHPQSTFLHNRWRREGRIDDCKKIQVDILRFSYNFPPLLPLLLSHNIAPPRARSLVRDGQTSPRRPRLLVSRSTCPPLSPFPHANSFVIGTAVINTLVVSTRHCQ